MKIEEKDAHVQQCQLTNSNGIEVLIHFVQTSQATAVTALHGNGLTLKILLFMSFPI